jgi:hypothetical protein
MRALLATLAAAAALFPAPAAAVDTDHMGFHKDHGVTIHWGDRFNDHRDRHRRHRDNDGDTFIGEWPQQGDTLWRSDSFNDWWHDRPDRAYPRWMVVNQNCDRQWYQGNVLKC